MTVQYYPNGIFEDKYGVCPVEEVSFNGAGSTANQIAIPAVTGKRHLIISGNIFSDGIASTTFINSPSGTAVHGYSVPANTSDEPNVQLPFNPAGHFESRTGEALRVSVTAAVTVIFNFRYITYTP